MSLFGSTNMAAGRESTLQLTRVVPRMLNITGQCKCRHPNVRIIDKNGIDLDNSLNTNVFSLRSLFIIYQNFRQNNLFPQLPFSIINEPSTSTLACQTVNSPSVICAEIVAPSRSIVDTPSWIIWRAKSGERARVVLSSSQISKEVFKISHYFALLSLSSEWRTTQWN